MRRLDEYMLRVRSLFRRSQVERELDDELAFHLEQQIDENIALGMSADDARFAALRTVGGVAQFKEECRDARRLNLLDDMVRDLRYAARSLRKSPGFAAAATLTLALGIGADTAIFSVLNGVLLRPLSYREPDRIVALNTRFIREGVTFPRLTGGDMVDLLSSPAFEAMSVYWGGEVGVQLRDRAEFTGVYWVMPEYAAVFDVSPLRGRLLAAGDAERGALVGQAFAERMFGGAAQAVGQPISVENRVYEIVGVLPAGFEFPRKAEVWAAAPKTLPNLNRTAYNFHAVARLRRGVSLAGAQAQLDTIASRLAAAFPDSNKEKGFAAVPLRDQLTHGFRSTLYILMGAVSLVLLIACTNVASLLLARATSRSREIALRSALGASRRRIVRQLMTESGVLALAGGALGLLLAYAGTAALIRFAPPDLPRILEVSVDRTVLVFATAASIVASFLFGLAPAWQASRAGLGEALKQGGSRGASGGSRRLRTALVIAEVSIAFVLATGAGLLFRSFIALNAVELGYRADGLLVMYAHAPAGKLSEYIEVTRFFDRLLPELASLPGVKSAAAAMGVPAGRYGSNGYYTIEGRPEPASKQDQQAGFRLSGPGYFATMGIPLLAGRDFSARDLHDAPFVAIVSQTLARRSFPREDPIGKRIQCGLDAPGKWMTIVGVSGDVRQEPASAPGQEIYMPLAQHPYFANEIEVMLRTAVEPASLAPGVRQKVRERNPGVAMSFTTMRAMLADAVTTPRFRAFLVGMFAGLALLLAMAGIYGTMAYATVQRTSEFGLRMALGAGPAKLFGIVLGQALLVAAAGLSIGLAVSLAAGRAIESSIFGLKPLDAATYGASIACTALVVVLGAAVPAWRAARVNPLTALRQE